MLDRNSVNDNGLELSGHSKSGISSAAGFLSSNDKKSTHFLDKASVIFGGSFERNEVEAVKLVLRCVAVKHSAYNILIVFFFFFLIVKYYVDLFHFWEL
jgi:hypothetical protein